MTTISLCVKIRNSDGTEAVSEMKDHRFVEVPSPMLQKSASDMTDGFKRMLDALHDLEKQKKAKR